MRIKVDKYPENAEWPKHMREVRAGILLTAVIKHMAPIHPGTGTDQSVHGGARIPVGRGMSTGKVPHEKILVSADGTELPLSFDALGDAHLLVNGKVRTTHRAAKIQKAILDQLEGVGLDRKDVARNLKIVWDSAMARYEANPSLIDVDRFYKMWHEALYAVALENGMEFEDVVATAAVLSPGLGAWQNIHYANDLSTWISGDLEWSGKEADAVREALDIAQDGILNPVWLKDQAGATKANLGKPKPPPEPGSHRWTQGQEVLSDLEKVRNMESFRVSDLDSLSAAYALSHHRRVAGGTTPDVPYNLSIDHSTGQLLPFPMGGFSTKNTQFFADAIDILRGNITPSETLGDVKTRSFFNNILDPSDSQGFQDLTIDYHMTNAAFMAVGFDSSGLISTPTIEHVSVGVRPVVADGLRPYIGYDLNGEALVSGRVQEIFWAEWSRGLREHRLVPEGTTPTSWFRVDEDDETSVRTITHWQGFDGTLYPLYNLKKRSR